MMRPFKETPQPAVYYQGKIRFFGSLLSDTFLNSYGL